MAEKKIAAKKPGAKKEVKKYVPPVAKPSEAKISEAKPSAEKPKAIVAEKPKAMAAEKPKSMPEKPKAMVGKPKISAEKPAAKAEKKPAAAKKEKPAKPRARGMKKTKEHAKILLKIAAKKKKNLPTFRGRFGKKMIRRIKKARWNKWRHNRGIDIKWGQQHGFKPGTGYRTPQDIRGMHPSGMHEIQVRSVSDLNKVPKGYAARMLSAIGHKKRVLISKDAKKLGIKLLN